VKSRNPSVIATFVLIVASGILAGSQLGWKLGAAVAFLGIAFMETLDRNGTNQP
jgi:hypothetical protein